VAAAARSFQTQFVEVTRRDFFPRGDVSDGVEKNPTLHNDHVTVWLARMINVFGAVPAKAAID